jgi:hypothetical protein
VTQKAAYRKVPVYIYRYEVVASDHPNVPVGTRLADARRDLVKDWITMDRDTGDMRSFVGERRERCCSECYVHHRKVRDYGHAGEHGESAPYTPSASCLCPPFSCECEDGPSDHSSATKPEGGEPRG